MLTFNEWREKYYILTDQEQKTYMNEIEEKYPTQIQFNKTDFLDFFNNDKTCRTVTEMGGWKGEMADYILSRHPELTSWTNYELCPNAIEKRVCNDSRYHTNDNITFRWWKNINFIYTDIFVASHCIEHISGKDFLDLVKKIHSHYIFFDAPLLYEGQSWDGYGGTHISELSWNDVLNIIVSKGYEIINMQKRPIDFDIRSVLFEKV